MKEIPLTRGYVAMVDDADYERLAQKKWCALVREDGRHVYAVHYKVVDGKVTATKMHRMLCDGALVDHKNGNGLDNRRENLRPATKSQNMWNRRSAMSACGFKGVTQSRGVWRSKRWRATIYQFGKRHRLGFFNTAEEAARAYDAAALEMFGEFAATNAALGLFQTAPASNLTAQPEHRVRPCACGALVPIKRGLVRCDQCKASDHVARRAAYNARRRAGVSA